jgi:hypothetical protein
MAGKKLYKKGIILEYVAFTDESQITASRFQSLSAFSIHKSLWNKAQNEITDILKDSDISEFKWQKLKDAKYYFCAKKIINFVFENIRDHKMRIDTLVWDTHDSRHTIQGRDDMANYERMFFHLLSGSMKRRPKSAKWDIRPDQRNGIDWSTINDCLAAKGRQQDFHHSLFGSFFSDQHFSIESFQEQCSMAEPLIQVADLFSGMAVFSKDSYSGYAQWKQQKAPSLFEEESVSFTNRESYRFQLLDLFNNKCKAGKYGVGLDSKQCLFTYDPKNPINFWHYEPQHDNDKAPVRGEI